MAHILIVDDESGIRESLRGVLEDEGYKTSVSPSGEDCLEFLRRTASARTLPDVGLPGTAGPQGWKRIPGLGMPPRATRTPAHEPIETARPPPKLGANTF